MYTFLVTICSDSATSAFRKLPSIYVFRYFPFGFKGRMLDLIVSVPDHCLSLYSFFLEMSILIILVSTLTQIRTGLGC